MDEINNFEELFDLELEVEDDMDMPTDKIFILNEFGHVVELEVPDDDGDDQT